MNQRILYVAFLFSVVTLSTVAQMPPRDLNQIRTETRQRNEAIESYDRRNGNGIVLPSVNGSLYPNGKIPGEETRKYVLAAQAETEVKILSVGSGDIMMVDDGVNKVAVRILGIDAPENGQPLFEEAQKSLSDLVSGKRVLLKYSLHNVRDRLGYFPAKVFTNGNDVGLHLLKSGLVWRNEEDEFFLEKKYYQANTRIQAEARTAKIGIWKTEKPQNPAKYRKRIEKEKRKTAKS